LTCTCPTCGQVVAEVDFRIDAGAGIVIGGGKVVDLPRREMQVLEFLWVRQGRTVTKQQIFDAVYRDEDVDWNVIESHMSKMRKKVAPLGVVIKSERFKGYQLLLGGGHGK